MTKPRSRTGNVSAVIAQLTPAPILPAEYVEATSAVAAPLVPAGITDDYAEPSEADAAAMAAILDDEPALPLGVPCPRCAGTGMVAALAEPGLPVWEDVPHALDAAPINSKIVVVLLGGKSHAVLAGPDGAKELPLGDPAHRLPEGARIRKLGEREYLAEQMSPAEDHAPITRESTARAIADFIPHFHATGPS